MKKLKLKMDELRVETFSTGEAHAGRGTVQGHYGTTHTEAGDTCTDYTCAGDTCGEYTCNGYVTSPVPEYHCIFC